jgi:hypothetical protein
VLLDGFFGPWTSGFELREKCPASWGHWLGEFPGRGLGDGVAPRNQFFTFDEMYTGHVARVCRHCNFV